MDQDLTVTIELLHRAQDGNREALNRLFARYYPRVARVVRVRLGQRLRSRVESSDILQDTFIAALAKFDDFEMREEASLINWLSRIAERQVLASVDHHGAKKRDPRREVPLVSHDESGVIGIDPVASGLLPDDVVANHELEGLVDECIGELEPKYREILLLRNYMNASWSAVAEEAKRPSAEAARMMHAKALVDLARLLKSKTSS